MPSVRRNTRHRLFTAQILLCGIGIAIACSVTLKVTAGTIAASTTNIGTEQFTLYVGDVFEMKTANEYASPEYSWVLSKNRMFLNASRDPIFRTRFVEAGQYRIDISSQDAAGNEEDQKTVLLNVRKRPLTPGEGTGSVRLPPETNALFVTDPPIQGNIIPFSAEKNVIKFVPATSLASLDLSVDLSNKATVPITADSFSRTESTPLFVWFMSTGATIPLHATGTATDGTITRQEYLLGSPDISPPAPPSIPVPQIIGIAEADGSIAFSYPELDQSAAPLFFQWKFGDGSVSLAKQPSHLFSQSGTYLVSVRVTDLQTNQVVAEASQNFTIRAIIIAPVKPLPSSSVSSKSMPRSLSSSSAAGGTTKGVGALLTFFLWFALGIGVLALLVLVIWFIIRLLNREGSLQEKFEQAEKHLTTGDTVETAPPLQIKRSTEQKEAPPEPVEASISEAELPIPEPAKSPVIEEKIDVEKAPSWLLKGLDMNSGKEEPKAPPASDAPPPLTAVTEPSKESDDSLPDWLKSPDALPPEQVPAPAFATEQASVPATATERIQAPDISAEQAPTPTIAVEQASTFSSVAADETPPATSRALPRAEDNNHNTIETTPEAPKPSVEPATFRTTSPATKEESQVTSQKPEPTDAESERAERERERKRRKRQRYRENLKSRKEEPKETHAALAEASAPQPKEPLTEANDEMPSLLHEASLPTSAAEQAPVLAVTAVQMPTPSPVTAKETPSAKAPTVTPAAKSDNHETIKSVPAAPEPSIEPSPFRTTSPAAKEELQETSKKPEPKKAPAIPAPDEKSVPPPAEPKSEPNNDMPSWLHEEPLPAPPAPKPTPPPVAPTPEPAKSPAATPEAQEATKSTEAADANTERAEHEHERKRRKRQRYRENLKKRKEEKKQDSIVNAPAQTSAPQPTMHPDTSQTATESKQRTTVFASPTPEPSVAPPTSSMTSSATPKESKVMTPKKTEPKQTPFPVESSVSQPTKPYTQTNDDMPSWLREEPLPTPPAPKPIAKAEPTLPTLPANTEMPTTAPAALQAEQIVQVEPEGKKDDDVVFLVEADSLSKEVGNDPSMPPLLPTSQKSS